MQRFLHIIINHKVPTANTYINDIENRVSITLSGHHIYLLQNLHKRSYPKFTVKQAYFILKRSSIFLYNRGGGGGVCASVWQAVAPKH